MKYEEAFANYHQEWFKHFSSQSLVEHERILNQLLDIELFQDSLLIDEAIVLHELIRDECVSRVAKSIQ